MVIDRRLFASLVAFASSVALGCNDGSADLAGCGSDSDCKSDRICGQSMCVDPGTDSSADSTTDDGSDTNWTTTDSQGSSDSGPDHRSA
jgi:hypothetical protein